MMIEPIGDDVPAEEIILRRMVTSERYREPQPAYNAPQQDTLEPVRNLVE